MVMSHGAHGPIDTAKHTKIALNCIFFMFLEVVFFDKIFHES